MDREIHYLSEASSNIAKTVNELGTALRQAKAAKNRRDRYFWKAYPHIHDDPNLLEATIKREREHGI